MSGRAVPGSGGCWLCSLASAWHKCADGVDGDILPHNGLLCVVSHDSREGVPFKFFAGEGQKEVVLIGMAD